jgi:hypothetical protein
MVYIKLQEPTNFCSYSQEYLSLRARQGKLKAVKIGRAWSTTKEWIKDYLVRAERYKTKVKPPSNLPIYAPDADMWEDEVPEDIERQKAFQRKFQFGLATSLVAALFLVSIFQGRQEVFTVAGKAQEQIISFAASLQDAAQESGFSAGKGIQVFLGGVLPAVASSEGWGEIAKDYFAWLGEQFRNIITGLPRGE